MSGRSEALSIRQQAELIEALTIRCVMRNGAPADETEIVISADDVSALKALASRLYRIAPYEDAIKRMVMAR